MSGIFSDDFVPDSLTPEDEEAMKDLKVPEEGENLEEAVVTEGPEEGGEGEPQEAPTAEGQPSTEKPDSLAKFKSDFALAKSYAEIKKAIGEPNDLERYTTREELEQAYLEAERRLGSRGKTITTQPQPAQDDRYQALEQQLAQTQGVLNQLATMILQQSQAPQNQEPQIPPEEQNFIKEMEEIYPGFSQYLERLVAQQVTPQLAPLQKLASYMSNRLNSCKDGKTLRQRTLISRNTFLKSRHKSNSWRRKILRFSMRSNSSRKLFMNLPMPARKPQRPGKSSSR